MQTMAVWLRALDCTLMLTELMSCSKKQHRNLWRRRQMYFCQVRRKFSSNAWLRFHPVIGILGRSIGPSQKLELAEILESIKNQSSKSKQQNLKVDLQPFVEAYNFYKINYGRNIQFDPSATNLCEYRMVLTLLMIIIKQLSYEFLQQAPSLTLFVFSLNDPSNWLTSGWDLLWHGDIWWDWERCEGDNWVIGLVHAFDVLCFAIYNGSCIVMELKNICLFPGYFWVVPQHDWWHDGSPHWILHSQWSWDPLLSHQDPLQMCQGWKRDASQWEEMMQYWKLH